MAAQPEQLNTAVGVLDKSMTRQLRLYLDICARCAICKDACHQYVTTQDIRYVPAYRAELIRRVYKKYFDSAGRFVPALYEGRDPDEQLLDELYEVTYACTGCRRCMYYCPFLHRHAVHPLRREGDAHRGRQGQRDSRTAC
jgi:Fe-S oxidoreductase